jgi:hypothetical protein
MRITDDDPELSADEEKLKVVVRVRPLQKSEQPWSTPRGTCEDDDEGAPGRQRQHGGGFSSTFGIAIPTTESALSMHEKSVTWEKNGQIKMLIADAVFSGSATQDEVFHSVEGELMLAFTLPAIIASLSLLCPTGRLHRRLARWIRLQRVCLVSDFAVSLIPTMLTVLFTNCTQRSNRNWQDPQYASLITCDFAVAGKLTLG